jgi:hydrogenase nickel incorporation protein HypA/HybF
MHELSIAISLVETAQEELVKLGNARIEAIHLKLGRLAGVARESLEFSYEVACQNTSLQGSRLIIEDVPVLIDCEQCKAPREIVSLEWFRCAVCGASGKILQGRELQVAALEITDNEISDGTPPG